MDSYLAEMYRESMGHEPPKPFAQQTPEEREQGWREFRNLVDSGTDADDAAVEELFEVIRRNREESFWETPKGQEKA